MEEQGRCLCNPDTLLWFLIQEKKRCICNNCRLFDGLFKVKKNGVLFFGISFLVLEIFIFLYYANEESDDVTNGYTRTIKY